MKRLDFYVWQDILINVSNGQAISDLCPLVDGQYSHIHEVVNYLAERKMLTITKSGRANVLELTPIGRATKDALIQVRECVLKTVQQEQTSQ